VALPIKSNETAAAKIFILKAPYSKFLGIKHTEDGPKSRQKSAICTHIGRIWQPRNFFEKNRF